MRIKEFRGLLKYKFHDPACPAAQIGVVLQGNFKQGQEEFRIPEDLHGHFVSARPAGIYIIQLFF
jgi:hypothetical protein